MKPRQFNLREELSAQQNIVRVYRWIRTYGKGVHPRGRMERRVRHRSALMKPGRRRSIFRQERHA